MRSVMNILICSGCLFFLNTEYCQAQNQLIHSLNIGDTIPDNLVLTNVYNYPVSKIRLSDLKGKLVILDFWSTWCGACISMFPKVHELQNHFKNSLQVILVNPYETDTKKKVDQFFQNRKSRTGLEVKAPYSLLQTALLKYFPILYIPHYVWINKDGKIIAQTSPVELTVDKIDAVLKGESVSFHNKIDLFQFNRKESFMENQISPKAVQFSSILTKYIEGLGNGSGTQRDSTGKITRFYFLNWLIYGMLQFAYSDVMPLPPSRTVIDVSEKVKFNPRADADEGYGRYENTYCYEVKTSPVTSDELRKIVREDSYRFFHLRVISEKRILNCLVLKESNQLKSILSKGGEEIVEIEKANKKKYIQNQPISVLTQVLNYMPCTEELVVIDETGMNEPVDVDFPPNFPDLTIDQLKAFLINKGFKISEEKRELPVAIITDKD